MPGNSGLRLHFQPVRDHAVHGLYDAIEAGQDPQMFLHVIVLAVLKYRRRHVCILNAVIGQQGGREIPPKIHMSETFVVLSGDLVIAGPELLLFFIGQTADPPDQNFRFFQKDRHR